jgi:hypothetical protein
MTGTYQIAIDNGGLNPHIVEDGRLLWLCPDHLKAYKRK